MPLSWLFQYFPVKAISVPSSRVTLKACGESCCRHSFSVFTNLETCTVSLRSPESVNSTIVTCFGSLAVPCPCLCASASAVSDFLEKMPIIQKYSPPPIAAAEKRNARRGVLPAELLSIELNMVLPVNSTWPRQKRISSTQHAQQLAIGCIVAQLPEHDAAQMVFADIGHLLSHRLWTVIAPEVVVVPHAACCGFFVVLSVHHARQLFERAVTA